VNCVALRKAFSPIVGTPFLTVILPVSEVHPANAYIPILVTLFGILTVCKKLQAANASSPILVTPFGILTFISEVQLTNSEFSIVVMLVERVTDSNRVHPLNA
jgi:hypothetical protein